MRHPNSRLRIAVLVGMFVAAVAGLSLADAIPQNPAYHLFADTRAWLGIPNFADVVSNLGFAVVVGLGLWVVFGPARREIFAQSSDAWPYVIFFIGVALVSAGSAYYHAQPNNERLVWDRLPMTVAFMAFFAAFLADRIHRRIGVYWLLPILLGAGFLSVVYWDWTESLGRGDLRFYTN